MAKEPQPPKRTTMLPPSDGKGQASQNSGKTSENAKIAQQIVNQVKGQPKK